MKEKLKEFINENYRLITVILGLLIIVGIIIVLLNQSTKTVAEGPSGVVIDERIADVVEEVEDTEKTQYIEVSHTIPSVIKNGKDKISFKNQDINENMYLELTIINDKGSECFKTNLIPPGETIQFDPSEILELGEHELCAHERFYYIDPENPENKIEQNGVNVPFSITIID